MKQEIKERIELINKGIVPAGYKKTPVGICPVEWEENTLKNIFIFKNGLNKEKSAFGKGTPIINYTDVWGKRGLKLKDVKGKVTLNKNEIENYSAKKGDVFFTRTSETINEIGLTSVLLEDIKDCVFSGFVLRGRPISNLIVNEYNQYCYSLDFMRNEITKKSSYTTRALTNGELLSQVLINLPTKSEQQKIAEILDCATRQVELQEQIVDKLKVQKKALMQRVFNGEYETISIQEALNKNYLREIKPKELQKYDGTKNYLSTSSIIQDEIVLIEDVVTYENRPSRAQMKPLENSVWFAKMTNSIKVIKANKNLEDNYILSTGFYGFLCDEINLNSNFLKQVFLSDYFNKTKDLYSEGSSQNGIKSNALEKLLIPFIELEKQLEIAEWLSFLDKNILLQQKLLEQYKLQQKALMQLLLTGIVRVC